MSRVDSATTCIIKKVNVICAYTWTVKNLNYLVEGKIDSIDSPIFFISFRKKCYLRLSLLSQESNCLCLTLMRESKNNQTLDYSISFSVFNLKNGKYIHQTSDAGYYCIKFEDLYEGKILPNDTLQIICEIASITYKTQSQSSFLEIDNIDDESEIENLPNPNKNLYLEDRFSDVKLKTSRGKELKAHKCILAARSSIFEAMFKHDTIENKTSIVDIKDIEYDVLKEMLRYIYVGKVENIKTVASDLLIAADKYDIQDLKSKCENCIGNNISVENAVQIFDLADRYNASRLKNRVMSFMKSNIDRIEKTDAFKAKLQAMGSFADFIIFLIQ